jgi:hypothetical protein
MPSKTMRVVGATTTVVALAALTAPATALASTTHKKKQPSAVDVYVEQVSNAGGHTTAPPTTGAGNSGSTSPSTSSTVPLSSEAKHALKTQGGKDTQILNELARQAGNSRQLAAVGSVGQPGTLDAAFDLGAGPTLLFALVLGTGLFVVVGGGLRGYRRRRGPRA